MKQTDIRLIPRFIRYVLKLRKLLREQLGTEADRIRFHCLKRYVGHRSLVVTDRRLPKAAILSVDHELRERVEVRILRQP